MTELPKPTGYTLGIWGKPVATFAAASVRRFGKASIRYDVEEKHPSASGKRISYLCREWRRNQKSLRATH